MNRREFSKTIGKFAIGIPFSSFLLSCGKESFDMAVEKDGQTNSMNDSGTSWFAKNIGKVKIQYPGQELYLSDFNLDTSKKLSVSKEDNFLFIPTKKIVEKIKNLI